MQYTYAIQFTKNQNKNSFLDEELNQATVQSETVEGRSQRSQETEDDKKLKRQFEQLTMEEYITKNDVSDSEPRLVSDTSRINTANKWGKLISSAGRKCLKPVTIQYLQPGPRYRLIVCCTVASYYSLPFKSNRNRKKAADKTKNKNYTLQSYDLDSFHMNPSNVMEVWGAR